MKILFYTFLVFSFLWVNKNLKHFHFSEKKQINIVVMGNVNSSKLNTITKEISEFYKMDVKFLGKTELPKDAELNNSYDANEILEYTKKKYENIEGKILVVTNVKLSNKNRSVLGLGFVDSKPCVVTTNNINTNEKLCKISIHELGHTFGLRHCDNSNCLMAKSKCEGCSSNNTKIWMCGKCRKEIF